MFNAYLFLTKYTEIFYVMIYSTIVTVTNHKSHTVIYNHKMYLKPMVYQHASAMIYWYTNLII